MNLLKLLKTMFQRNLDSDEEYKSSGNFPIELKTMFQRNLDSDRNPTADLQPGCTHTMVKGVA